MIGPHEETDAPAQTLRHGIALHRAGALAEASRLYEAVLERAPDDLDALRLLGILLAQSGDTEHGAMFIAAAATRMPDTATAETAFGDTLRRLDRQSDALAAFDRAIAADPQCAAAHAGRGLCLRGLGHLDAALEAHERALALDPANHAAGFGRGVVLQALGRIAEAADAYRETLRHAPRDEALWTNLSLALGALGRHADALDAADAALAQAPHMIEALAARAAALRALGDATRALAALDRAIAIDPGRATLHANRGNALRDLSRLADARDAYDRAVALDPGNADAHRLRAMCLLLAGDWVAGWPEWEWRKRATEASGARHADRPAWTGAEDPAGRRIFLHWEQGFGDTIQFCRYAPLLAARGAHVTLAVQGPLLRLASSLAAPRLDVIGGMREPTDGFDLHCPLMSLPLAFATTPRSVPPPAPLVPPPDLRAAWAARLGPADGRPRIGLAWSGRPEHANDRNRSLAAAALATLLVRPARWICTQPVLRPADTDWLRADGRISVFGPAFTDFADTAALIANLDLVITVDTSVAHLAGSIGVPVWILLPRDPDWRWLTDRADSPWYPSARLFRQNVAGDWQEPIARVVAALEERFG
jgi:tetratricopeptide (TPR) repeat protein